MWPRDASRRRITRFTAVFLLVYVPLETWLSFPRLWDLMYLVDVVGMVLLLAGLLSLRRAAPYRGASVLAAGFGWSGANFWRAMAQRLAAGYDSSRYPEGKIVSAGPLSAGIVGGVLIGLCAVGMLRAIQIASQPVERERLSERRI